MRLLIAIAAMTALWGYPAFAEDTDNKPPTRIEISQEAKAFIFIVDGEPVAMLDKAGLHVSEGIEYGTSLTDVGQDHAKKRIASQMQVAHD